MPWRDENKKVGIKLMKYGWSFTYKEDHWEPLYDRQCEDSRIQNSLKRDGQFQCRPKDCRYPVGSFASREPIAASDSAADGDCLQNKNN